MPLRQSLPILKTQGISNSDSLLSAAVKPTVHQSLTAGCGCDTRVTLELAKRKPDNLHAKIFETNAKTQLTNQAPGAKPVASWVVQAEALAELLS